MNAISYAESFLPKTKPALQRSFWSEDLNELKLKSIDCCRFWKANGKPKSGPIFDCKKTCVYKFKSAIRKAKHDERSNVNDALHEDLISRDSDSFWKSWRNQNEKNDSLVTRVEGETNEKDIAGAFAAHFKRVYSGNDTSAHRSLRDEFYDKFTQYYNLNISGLIGEFYLSWSDMTNIVSRLKAGKATSDGIRPEHVLFGSEKLIVHLLLLFNAMIQHGYVVRDFLQGTITPIVKDSMGDVSDCSNYRGITLGPLFSKMFEIGLDIKVSPFLPSDPLQFGFQKKTSTSHALYALKSCIDHFTTNRSNAYVAFLDCTKAFDRISHFGLFLKLMEKGVPLVLLMLIIYWHLNMSCRVKWGTALSESFPVPLGTKQGGIMSPRFFALYVDEMLELLRSSGVGCHLLKMFLGAFLFADDLALVAPSRSALQKLIDICNSYCTKYCLSFNTKKSGVMLFGKTDYVIAPLILNGAQLNVVHEWKYLGTTICAGKSFSFTARPDISSFYRAANSVLNVLTDAHEHVLMSLLYTNCIPIISYACSMKEYSSSDMTNCNTAINNVIRKIFGFDRRESVRLLREIGGYKSIYTIFQNSRNAFLKAVKSHHNPVIRFIATLNQLDDTLVIV